MKNLLSTALIAVSIMMTSVSVQAVPSTGASGGTGNSGGSDDNTLLIAAAVAAIGYVGYKVYTQRAPGLAVAAPAKRRYAKRRYVKRKYASGVRHKHTSNRLTKSTTHTHKRGGVPHRHRYGK